MNGYQSYQRNKYETASPHRLIVMLYDGALRFGRQAIECIKNNDIQGKSTNIAKFQDVVYELIACLNLEKGKDIASNLLSIYNYIIELSLKSSLNMNTKPLQEALSIIEEIKSSWVQIGKEVQLNG